MNKKKRKLRRRQRVELIAAFSVITIATFIISIIVVSGISYFVVCTGMFNIVDKDLPGAGRLIVL